MTRLNRETNPIPGEKPGFLPQFIDDNGTPVNVTPSTPHPSHDSQVKAELELVKAELQQVKTALQGTINTELTGSFVGYSHEAKPTGKRNDQFLELDTKDVYFHDGQGWVKW